MPFGLKIAGNSFIRVAQQVLRPIRDFTESFVDDMAVLSQQWQDHMQHLEKYLRIVKESGLTMKISKCSFAKRKVLSVGHIVGSGCMEPDPAKVATVRDMGPPVTKRDVKRLVRFFGYFRAFIPSFAETAKIITDLTQKDVPNRVPWQIDHQQASDKLKYDLCNATALHTIKFGKDFGLLVDASGTAVGCCLIQWSEVNLEKPIAFASMKLSETQTRWATIEREAYAVIWALQRFRCWIFGSKIQIFSDHNPLTFITESAPKSSKLARWALALQEFNIEFRYRAAKQNVIDDFLSRL